MFITEQPAPFRCGMSLVCIEGGCDARLRAVVFPHFVHSCSRETARHVPLSHEQNIKDTNAPQRSRSPQRLELLQALYDALVGVSCGNGVRAVVTARVEGVPAARCSAVHLKLSRRLKSQPRSSRRRAHDAAPATSIRLPSLQARTRVRTEAHSDERCKMLDTRLHATCNAVRSNM